ncbi:chlorohydrolase [Streptococcus pneumoniae]|nr:chlorohydrolase [Streptococcus pneumoniae]
MNLTKSAQRVDETAEVGSKHDFEVEDKLTKVVSYTYGKASVTIHTVRRRNHTYGKATLTKFELDFRRV